MMVLIKLVVKPSITEVGTNSRSTRKKFFTLLGEACAIVSGLHREKCVMIKQDGMTKSTRIVKQRTRVVHSVGTKTETSLKGGDTSKSGKSPPRGQLVADSQCFEMTPRRVRGSGGRWSITRTLTRYYARINFDLRGERAWCCPTFVLYSSRWLSRAAGLQARPSWSTLLTRPLRWACFGGLPCDAGARSLENMLGTKK